MPLRVFHISGLFALILVVGVACATAKPTTTPTPEPTIPHPTPTEVPTVTREYLPGMVLDQTDVDAEFPGLSLGVEDSGYVDNEAATEDTIDRNDTAADLTAGGRLDGYRHEFLNPAALFEASPAAGLPVSVEALVDLFDSQRSAQAYLQLQMEDFRRFQGIEIERATLEEFQELGAPDVGTDAVAGRLTYSTVGFKVKLYSTFVAWIKGPVVARIVVGALDDADLRTAVNRLALRMDQRIDGVLAGEIRVTPIIPSPTPSGDAGESDPGFQFSIYQGAEVLGARELSLSDLRGKPLVLNFWAGFLPPSRTEMPVLQEFYIEYKDRVTLLGLDVGPFVGLGSNQDARNLLRELGITYPAGFTSDEGILGKYEIVGFPSTIFFTADGKIFRKWMGALNKAKLVEITEEMLALPLPEETTPGVGTPTPLPTATPAPAPTATPPVTRGMPTPGPTPTPFPAAVPATPPPTATR